jgi:hypothetical protein
MHPPDPETRRAALAGDPVAKSENKHRRTYWFSVEVQALLSIFAQIAIPFALAVLMGGLR